MRRFQPSFVVVITLAVGILAGGCSQALHVSPSVFVWKSRTQVTTVHDVDFVGVYQNRAYLSEWAYLPVVGPSKWLLWTEADRLSPQLLRELEAAKAEEELEANDKII